MQKTPFNIDQLTLEYFTNKTTYKKYLAKTDPETSKLQLTDSIKGKEASLVTFFSRMLEEPTSNEFLKVFPTFESYIFAALEHLEKHESTHSDSDSNEYNVDESNLNDNETLHDNPKEIEIAFQSEHDTQLSYPASEEKKRNVEFWKSEKVHKIL